MNSPHKGLVMRKMIPFDDVIMDQPESRLRNTSIEHIASGFTLLYRITDIDWGIGKYYGKELGYIATRADIILNSIPRGQTKWWQNARW